MGRKDNFEELTSFKSIIKDPKRHDLPSFEGIHVSLEDVESGVMYNIPVTLIESISDASGSMPVVQIRLITGDVYLASGTVIEVLGRITEAKIKGGVSDV